MANEIRCLKRLAIFVHDTAKRKRFGHEPIVQSVDLDFGEFKGRRLTASQCWIPDKPDLYLRKTRNEKSQKEIEKALIQLAKKGKEFSTNSHPRKDRKLGWQLI